MFPFTQAQYEEWQKKMLAKGDTLAGAVDDTTKLRIIEVATQVAHIRGLDLETAVKVVRKLMAEASIWS